MKKGVIVVFALMLVFGLVMVQAKLIKEEKPKCDFGALEKGMDSALVALNGNTKYVEFIGASKYHTVRVVIDKKEYYFVYENGIVKRMDSGKEDFSVKMTCSNVNKIIDAYTSKDPKFKKLVVNQIPIKVRVNLYNQCMDTPWCKKEAFGK